MHKKEGTRWLAESNFGHDGTKEKNHPDPTHCGNWCRCRFDNPARQNGSAWCQKCCIQRVNANVVVVMHLQYNSLYLARQLMTTTATRTMITWLHAKLRGGRRRKLCFKKWLSFQAKYFRLLQSYLACNPVQAPLAMKKPDAISHPYSPH